MGYITAGINHRTAPIELREEIAFSSEQIADALQSARSHTTMEEIAILSTCNRTEIYCAINSCETETFKFYYNKMMQWITLYHQVNSQLLTEHSYCFYDREVVTHMMRVACGLDSMVFGEPQILGQLKSAYTHAQKADTTGPWLNLLFQQSFTTAKQIRTETAINQHPVSVAYAATWIAKQIFSNLCNNTVLLIGAGETIELTTRHLHRHGVSDIIVVNRTIERARQLTNVFGGKPALLTELPQILHKGDIIISSTASPVPVVGKGIIERALKQRKHKPMFLLDLAVPRDIEPEVSALPNVFLYNIDDLQHVIEDNMQQRKKAASQAEQMIETDTLEFMTRLRSLDAVGLLRRYRQSTESIRDLELKKAMQGLAKGAKPEEVLRQFARSLTNKLMHQPSIQLKSAAANGQQEKLEWAENLLGLNSNQTTNATQDT